MPWCSALSPSSAPHSHHRASASVSPTFIDALTRCGVALIATTTEAPIEMTTHGSGIGCEQATFGVADILTLPTHHPLLLGRVLETGSWSSGFVVARLVLG